MKKNIKLLPIELSIIFGILLSITASFFQVFAISEDISNRILRLHIVANSDDPQDQDLKIKVRDEILNTFDFSDEFNLQKAKDDVCLSLSEIEKVAKAVVEQEGYSYDVKAQILNMYFDTRQYDDFTMPAGKYDALRITIGHGDGHNWWCVLYPPLCVSAAEPSEELNKTLTDEQQNLIENNDQYDVRFAAIELFEGVKNFFNR